VAAKLSNEGFTSSAPADVIAKEREKLDEARARVAKLEKYLADLA
jgi:valyl-tRNA synthetase